MTKDLYVIRNGERGLVKVGATVNLKSRLSAIRSSHPEAVVLKVFKGVDPKWEMPLHAALKPWKSHGEWYVASREVLAVCDVPDDRLTAWILERRDEAQRDDNRAFNGRSWAGVAKRGRFEERRHVHKS